MTGNFKLAIISFFSVFISFSALADINATESATQNSPNKIDLTTERLNNQTQKEKNDDFVLQVIQSGFGCSTSQWVSGLVDTVKGVDNKTEYQCEVTEVKEDYNEYRVIIQSVIYYSLIYLIPVAIIFLLTIHSVGYSSGKPIDGFSPAKQTIYLLFVYILAVPLPFFTSTTKLGTEQHHSLLETLVLTGVAYVGEEVATSLQERKDRQLIYFSDVRFPYYESRVDFFENALELFIRASSISKGDKIVFTVVEEQDQLAAYAYLKQFSAKIVMPLDIQGEEIAKKYGVFDYREKEVNWYKQNLTAAFNRTSVAALNFISSMNDTSTFGKKFDMNMSCDDIESLRLDVYEIGDLEALYTKKVASCISASYMAAMHKYKNLATDDYLNNQNYLKSRRLSVCTHDSDAMYKFRGYTKDEANKLVETCLQEACGSAGSPYICSTVLNVYDKVKSNDRKVSIKNIPTLAFNRDSFDTNENAKLFGEKLSFNYEEHDNDYNTNTNINSLFTMSFNTSEKEVKTEYGYIDRIRRWADQKYNELIGMSFDMGDISSLNAMGIYGEDGFLGLNKLAECIKHPFRFYEGYNCRSVNSEIDATGSKMIKSGIDKLVMRAIGFGSLKNASNVSKAEIKQTTAMASGVVGLRFAGVIAYLSGTSDSVSIYGENSKSFQNYYENAATYMALYAGGSAGRNLIMAYGAAEIAAGVLLKYVIPFAVLYYFLLALASFLMNLAVNLTLSIVTAIGSMFSTSFIKKDLDFPDFILYGILCVIFPALLYGGLIFRDFFFNFIFASMPLTVIEIADYLTLSSMSTALAGSNFISMIISSFVTIGVIYWTLKASNAWIVNYGNMTSWALFGNGEMTSNTGAENVHNDQWSRLK